MILGQLRTGARSTTYAALLACQITPEWTEWCAWYGLPSQVRQLLHPVLCSSLAVAASHFVRAYKMSTRQYYFVSTGKYFTVHT